MSQKGRKNTLIVRSLNVSGIMEEKDQKQTADDIQTYKIDIMKIQEHLKCNTSRYAANDIRF